MDTRKERDPKRTIKSCRQTNLQKSLDEINFFARVLLLVNSLVKSPHGLPFLFCQQNQASTKTNYHNETANCNGNVQLLLGWAHS